MKSKLKKIIKKEATLIGFPVQTFKQYAESGCRMVFKDNLNHFLESLGTKNLTDEDLRVLIIFCTYGGVVANLTVRMN